MSTILYKYLDITGGICMIGNKNLQFTNASKLNDPFDCHPDLVDYSDIPESVRHGVPLDWYIEKEKNDAFNLRNDTWLSSFSKENDSLLMWSHYCWNHSGICVGLDLDKVMASVPPLFGTKSLEPYVIEVQYVDINQRPDFKTVSWDYLWRVKDQKWEYEQEVRLVVDSPYSAYAAFTPAQAEEAEKDKNKIWDWREIHHYLPLNEDCFESIYFGKDINPKEKEKIINFARKKLNPDIKLYQMRVDENAFRLKAERITE